MDKEVMVLNLASGKEYTYYGLTPIDALVSCAIYEAHKTQSLNDANIRKQYFNQVLASKSGKTASIGDLTVIL